MTRQSHAVHDALPVDPMPAEFASTLALRPPLLEPAAPLEEHEERRDGRDLEPDAEAEEARASSPMWRTIQPKFWPKKPVMKVSGRKIVAMIVSCFITTLSRFETVER